MYTHSKQGLNDLAPAEALQYLKEGNERFVKNLRADRNLLQQVNETRDGQFPFAAILSCMDSRTSAELIFDQGLGDVFSIRVAGNVLNEDVLGSMEYAVKAVGSKIIVVLGHTKCGAIIGACNDVKMGNLTQLLDKIKPAMDGVSVGEGEKNGTNPEFVNQVTELNVHIAMKQIKEKSPIIAELVEQGSILLVGGVYNVDSGKVDFFEV